MKFLSGLVWSALSNGVVPFCRGIASCCLGVYSVELVASKWVLQKALNQTKKAIRFVYKPSSQKSPLTSSSK